jgi:TonB family protein
MVQVEADGAVSEAKVLSSSGSSVLDAAVLKSVREGTFRPASRGGLPVAAEKKISVRFDLTE